MQQDSYNLPFCPLSAGCAPLYDASELLGAERHVRAQRRVEPQERVGHERGVHPLLAMEAWKAVSGHQTFSAGPQKALIYLVTAANTVARMVVTAPWRVVGNAHRKTQRVRAERPNPVRSPPFAARTPPSLCLVTARSVARRMVPVAHRCGAVARNGCVCRIQLSPLSSTREKR